MWTDLCSLIAKAVAERAMLPSGETLRGRGGKKKETTQNK